MPNQSQGLAEVLKALIVAFGGATPTSDGLGELYVDLIAAVQAGGGGSQGPQGNQGAQGIAGAQGPQGTPGGPQGAQGAQGAQGNQGTQGHQGFQGATGSGGQGAQGAQGATGSTGPQGNQGVQGAQGNQGTTGTQGNQGNQGTQGHQGFQGATGTGSQGAQGAQGAQGPSGGAQGAQGAQGPQGFQGAGGTGNMPISNTTGIGSATETPDPISGANSANWVTFPADQQAMAYGLTGDSFPRVVFGSDPTGVGAVLFGDGTFDPTGANGSSLFLFAGANRGNTPSLLGGGGVGVILNQLGFTGINGDTPAGQIGGELGDLAATNQIGGSFCPGIWRCTTAGTSSTAVWELVSVLADVSPLSFGGGGFVPPNAGIIWQETDGSGAIWVSNGTATGNWTQIAPGVNVLTTTFTSNAYTLALTDANTAQQATNGSTAATVTVPTNASIAIPVGSVVTFTQIGTGQIKLAAAGGVTIQSSVSGGFVSGTTGCRAEFSTIALLKTATNTWVLSGDAA